MCTSIVEIVAAEGAAKDAQRWFALERAVVTYDHPHFALLDDGINIDFFGENQRPGTRAAVELSLETARALHAALGRAIAAAEREESERDASPHAA